MGGIYREHVDLTDCFVAVVGAVQARAVNLGPMESKDRLRLGIHCDKESIRVEPRLTESHCNIVLIPTPLVRQIGESPSVNRQDTGNVGQRIESSDPNPLWDLGRRQWGEERPAHLPQRAVE